MSNSASPSVYCLYSSFRFPVLLLINLPPIRKSRLTRPPIQQPGPDSLSGRIISQQVILHYRPRFDQSLFTTDHASISLSRLHAALAGLVDGRASAGLPSTGSIYLL